MNRRTLAAGLAVVALTLVGCTPGSSPTATPGATTAGPAPSATLVASAPTPGSTAATVPNPRESTKAPVNIDKPAMTGGVTAKVVAIRAIKAKARMPGEVAGPALAITVRLTNGSKRDLDASGVLVTLYDSKKAPGGEMSSPPAKAMSGVLQPGKSATGVYVFTVPVKRRSPIMVNVTLPTETPVLAFRGTAPVR